LIGSERLQFRLAVRPRAIMAGRPTTCIHLDRSFSSGTSGGRSMHPLHSHTHVPGAGDASSVSTRHWESSDPAGRSLSIGDRHILRPTPRPARAQQGDRGHGPASRLALPIRTHVPLYSSSIRPSQQDSLLYIQFSRTHPSSISSFIHSIHYETHLSLYLNISMCDLVLKDLLRQI
jgi:hypothetical protein